MSTSRWAAGLVVLVVLTAGCGRGNLQVTSAAHISSSRCAANRAAGTITYLTGFGYQGDVGILDVLEAKAAGDYAAECLTVSIRPGTGDAGSTAQLTAAGKVTISELGAPSDVMQVLSSGVHVTPIATYGNVPAITLLTSPSITNLKQLEGKTLGYKGSMPPQITAMLEVAGVDVSKVHEVGVGYDPTILPRGQVSALTAYKSNEPVELRADGDKFREWDPDRYGIKGSFNTLVVNQGFLADHRGAVQDFLRATFRAYQSCVTNVAPCVAAAANAQSGYDRTQNTAEWKIQVAEVQASLLPGQGVGAQSVAQWTPEANLLTADHLVKQRPDLAAIVDSRDVASIYQGRSLIWPGP